MGRIPYNSGSRARGTLESSSAGAKGQGGDGRAIFRPLKEKERMKRNSDVLTHRGAVVFSRAATARSPRLMAGAGFSNGADGTENTP